MTELSGIPSSSAIVNLAIVCMVCEALALSIYYVRTGRGISPGSLLATISAGMALLLALRSALAAAPDAAIISFLVLALTAHIADVALRWRGR